MNSTKLKLEYSVSEQNGGIPVIVVAAGSSSRMKGINKTFLSLVGIPVIARTLSVFENSPAISRIIVVTAKESVNEMQLICDNFMISKVTDIVCGGDNRHQSVMNGIKMLAGEENKVLIHDGARPFIDSKTVTDVANALDRYDAALCVRKINDTVKKVNLDGVVEKTVDRTYLYSAQTPQGVDVKKYLKACEACENVDAFTDDASIMEAAGFTVLAVEGNVKNIKITTREDIILAEAFIKGEENVCE